MTIETRIFSLDANSVEVPHGRPRIRPGKTSVVDLGAKSLTIECSADNKYGEVSLFSKHKNEPVHVYITGNGEDELNAAALSKGIQFANPQRIIVTPTRRSRGIEITHKV